MSITSSAVAPYSAPGEPQYDVKIIGGKRIVLLKNNFSPTRRKSNTDASNNPPKNQNESGRVVLPPIRSPSGTPPKQNKEPNGDLQQSIQAVLRNYDNNKLKAILDDLEERDLQDRGLANPKNLSSIMMMHKVPIPPSLMAALYLRFSSDEVPGTINYENLLHFLINSKNASQVLSEGSEQSNSLSANQKREPPDSSQRNKRKISKRYAFPEREDMKLIMELENELSDDNPNLDLFRRRAIELDSERRGVLSRPQIDELLRIAGITLSESLTKRLFQQCDKHGYGLTDFTDFLDHIERAKPQTQDIFRPSERRIIRARTPLIPLGPLPRGFQTENPKLSPITYVTSLPRLVETPLDREEWMRRYERMAYALHSSLQERPGYLPPEEIRHIVDTYNVVYNLQFDQMKVNDAMQAGHRGLFEQVDLDKFLQHLLEKHYQR